MAGLDWTVKYSSGGTLYEINDVQEISFSLGRNWATDPFTAGTGTIVCRNPSGWSAPLPTMGKSIFVYPPAGIVSGYNGRIVDISIVYGELASMDEVTITFEGYLGSIGRYQLTSETLTQSVSTTQAGDVAVLAGATGFAVGGLSTVSGQTYSGNALNILSEIMLTEIGRIVETNSGTSTAAPVPALLLYGRQEFSTFNDLQFSDVPADWGASYFKYNDVEFKSAAENYFTQVTIQPQGLATQKTGTGKFSLVQESVDVSTSQALSHAQYLKAQYGNQTITPYSVTIDYASQNAAAQTVFPDATINYYSGAAFYTTIARKMLLKFRGETYLGIVEGYQVNATPENTIVKYFFSPQDVNNYLILNDSVYGTLGTSGTYPGNKLGF